MHDFQAAQELFEIAFIGIDACICGMDRRIFSKIPNFALVVTAAMEIHDSRSISEIMGVSYTMLCMEQLRK